MHGKALVVALSPLVVVAAALAGDDDKRLLPLNPFENAKTGDWESFVGETSQDGVVSLPQRLSWTVRRPKANELVVKMTNHGGGTSSDEAFFDPSKTPDVEAYLNMPPSPVKATISDVKVEDEKRTVAGRTFACKKYSCVLNHGGQVNRITLWLCPEVKGSGLVALYADYEGATTIRIRQHLAGFGSAGKVEWGSKAEDIDVSKFVPTLVSKEGETIPDEKVLERSRELLAAARASIEAIRGAKLDFEVPIKVATKEDSRKFLDRETASRFPVTSTPAGQAALARFKLLREDRAWNRWVLSFFWGHAFYDPAEKTLFVGSGPVAEARLRAGIFHELCVAAAHRRALLAKAAEPAGEDAAIARRFVVEGEASLLSTIEDARAHGKEELVGDMVALGVENAPRELELARTQRHKAGEGAAARDVAETLPYYSMRASLDPGPLGAALVLAVRKAGGWKAVDALAERPLASTAQALHPGKLVGKRDEPLAVALPDLASLLGSGWKRTVKTTLGELGIQCVLAERGRGKTAAAATAGWKGDSLQVYEGENVMTFVWLTTWSGEKAAKDFEAAWRGTLDDGAGVEGSSVVARSGADVVVVEGAADEATCTALAEAAHKKARKTAEDEPAKK